MNVFVSAIEVGSVRALLPVCIELVRAKHSVLIGKKGHFAVEVIEELASSYVDIPFNEDEIKILLQEKHVDILLFSVNIHDTHPLRIARIAKELRIETVHLLDYWNGYRARMELDGEDRFQPTQYLVPDEYAKKKAIKEGVSSDLVSVVGQPAFVNAEDSYHRAEKLSNPFGDISKDGYKTILFASEPVAFDQGSSLEENKNYRGYTEKDVFQILIKTLKSMNEKYMVMLLPHPRQDIKDLENIWNLSGGNKYGRIVNNFRSRDLLPFVNGVTGMASTLLYEAWLVGKPVLSLQPGLRNDSLRMLSEKDGVVFIDKYANANEQVLEWFSDLSDCLKYRPQSELKRHKQAPIKIVKEIIDIFPK
jgi:hypothetical protein